MTVQIIVSEAMHNLRMSLNHFKFLNLYICLVVSMSASHAVGLGFAPRPGHTKDHHKKVQTSSLLYMQT